MRVKVVRVRDALTPSGLPDIDWALNPYLGCYHSCIYCYGRLYVKDAEVASSWGDIVVVKENVVDALRRGVRSRRSGVVGVGTITDAYQPVEARYGLTRRSLEVLLSSGFRVSIQTKSTLVLRDADLLSRYRGRVDVGFTITTMDRGIASFLEPRAPPPRARADALARLRELGIDTWVFLGPIVPEVTDSLELIEEVVEVAEAANSPMYYDKLRVKGFMLSPDHPLYPHAVKALRYRWRNLFTSIESICRKHGVRCGFGFSYGSAPSPSKGLTRFANG